MTTYENVQMTTASFLENTAEISQKPRRSFSMLLPDESCLWSPEYDVISHRITTTGRCQEKESIEWSELLVNEGRQSRPVLSVFPE